jgi:hypothetical protein
MGAMRNAYNILRCVREDNTETNLIVQNVRMWRTGCIWFRIETIRGLREQVFVAF